MELEKYCRALLELEIWYQKQKRVNSLPLLTAKFFDFHQYVSSAFWSVVISSVCYQTGRLVP